MCDTLNVFDNAESRTPIIIVKQSDSMCTTSQLRGGVSKTLNAIAADSDHVPCVITQCKSKLKTEEKQDV